MIIKETYSFNVTTHQYSSLLLPLSISKVFDRYSSVRLNTIKVKNSLKLMFQFFNLILAVSLNLKPSQAISKKNEVKPFISVKP